MHSKTLINGELPFKPEMISFRATPRYVPLSGAGMTYYDNVTLTSNVLYGHTITSVYMEWLEASSWSRMTFTLSGYTFTPYEHWVVIHAVSDDRETRQVLSGFPINVTNGSDTIYDVVLPYNDGATWTVDAYFFNKQTAPKVDLILDNSTGGVGALYSSSPLIGQNQVYFVDSTGIDVQGIVTIPTYVGAAINQYITQFDPDQLQDITLSDGSYIITCINPKITY